MKHLFIIILLCTGLEASAKKKTQQNVSFELTAIECRNGSAYFVINIHNLSTDTSYIPLTNIFYHFQALHENGEQVWRRAKSDHPGTLEVCSVAPGKLLTISLPFQTWNDYKFSVVEKYIFQLSYYNESRRRKDKKMLRGTYPVKSKPLQMCIGD